MYRVSLLLRINHTTYFGVAGYLFISQWGPSANSAKLNTVGDMRGDVQQHFASTINYSPCSQTALEVFDRYQSITTSSCQIHLGAILRAHPIRGAWRMQRCSDQEASTISSPVYNKQHRSQILFVKVAPGIAFTF